MRKYYVLAAVLAAVASILVGQRLQLPNPPGGQSAAIDLPARIVNPSANSPLHRYSWISEHEFIDEFGFLRADLLEVTGMANVSERHEAALAKFNATGEPPTCQPITRSSGLLSPYAPSPSASLEALLARSAAVFTGVVVGSEGGFSYGLPGQMLQIQVDRWLGDRGTYSARQEAFVFYPGGEISIGFATYCIARYGFPPAPTLGDRVLLFPDLNAVGTEPEFLNFESGPNTAGLYWSEGDTSVKAARELINVIPSLGRTQNVETLLDTVQATARRAGLR